MTEAQRREHLRRVRARDARWVGRLAADAVNKHVTRGRYRREKTFWPQPSPVRRLLLAAMGMVTVFVQETWVLEEGGARAVASWRQLGGRQGWTWRVRVLSAAAVLDAALGVPLWWAWRWHPALGLAVAAVDLALGGPAMVATFRERRGAAPLRTAVDQVRAAARGPVYEAAALAATGAWTGVHLARALLAMAEERGATVVMRTEGGGRERLYEGFGLGFVEAARARLFWGECVVMVWRPAAERAEAAVVQR